MSDDRYIFPIPEFPWTVRREEAVKLLKEMTDDERLDLFTEFCRHCGAVDPECTCMRDD